MAPNLPKLTALLVNSYGLFIFRSPATCTVHQYSTLIPSLIFALAVYAFAIDVSYFKIGYRKVFLPCQFVLEFFATVFLLEMSLLDFWFPLEKFVLTQLVIASDLLKTYHCLGINTSICCYLYSGLRNPVAGIGSSYALACFFLGCIMQGTGVIDFRLMRCGVDVFMQSLVKRVKKGLFNLWPYKGMKFQTQTNRSRRCMDLDESTISCTRRGRR